MVRGTTILLAALLSLSAFAGATRVQEADSLISSNHATSWALPSGGGTIAGSTVSQFGTGASSLTSKGMLYGNGTSAIGATAAGSQYQSFQAGSGGTPTVDALHLDQSAAVTGILPVANSTVANQSAGTCTTSKTIDWSTGNSFTLTLTNGNACAVTFSNAVSGQTITIDYTQAGSGGGTATITYSTTVKWAAGTVPTMTTGNSTTDTCTFKYNGTDYRGNCVQNLL